MSMASALGPSRRRAGSMASHSCPQIIPGATDSVDGSSDLTYDSLRSHWDARGSALNPANASGMREPTRSFIHRSYVGPQATVDSAQYALSVRDDSAELASYALSDRASIQSASSPKQPTQSHLESFFDRVPDSESTPSRELGRVKNSVIHEVSEPTSPDNETPPRKVNSTSALANLLRISPPSRSPPDDDEGGSEEGYDREEGNGGLPDVDSLQGRLIITSNGVKLDTTERTPLLPKSQIVRRSNLGPTGGQYDDEDLEIQAPKMKSTRKRLVSWPKEKVLEVSNIIFSPKNWNAEAIADTLIYTPANNLPAAVLGALLNVLDALSYGMILFPLGTPIFAHLGPAGISMFYVSCIVSQLVFSCGGSAFHNGIGSEMIEVVPFFHKMAFTIMARVGEDKPAAVIATTIVAYQLSSILTGLVFYLQGVFRFGYIVGFIPRHILIGCIGGVGWFLIATGFEVSARLEGNLNYDLTTLKIMFQLDTIFHWAIPFALAVLLGWLQGVVKQSSLKKYLLPGFILGIGAVFYFFVFSIDALEMNSMRNTGWIFASPEGGQSWWYFWTLYTGENFKLIHWGAIMHTLPAMFALTFFGILHVPINVPALGFALGQDDLDLDRELKAHGVSNALSGIVGSMQNYLVYTNSLVFIKAGAKGRSAGIMLAGLTVILLLSGPATIGYIPVMMVGCLIFLLGFELFMEAVWDAREKLNWFEYITVIAIVLIMGIYDFVVGIFVGIGLAFVSTTYQTSRIAAVRASYSGNIVHSTVRRSATQTRYLHDVGEQTHVKKLAGYLFFGTIVSAETEIRQLIEEKSFEETPIRFLVLDLQHVTDIDYSAAEAFNRLSRVLDKKGVTLYLSGIKADSKLRESLLIVGLGSEIDVKMFEDLNSALESSENEYLKTLYASKAARTNRYDSAHLDIPQLNRVPNISEPQNNSPRGNQLRRSATTALDQHPNETRYYNMKEPLRLILQTFHGLTKYNEDFWFPAVKYFEKRHYAQGTILFHRGEKAKGFYLVEEGILRADYDLPQGRYFENIVAGTTCGELPFFSETDRTATVLAERPCVCWLLSREKWEELRKKDPEIAQELLQVSLKLTSERMSAITSYVLSTAG